MITDCVLLNLHRGDIFVSLNPRDRFGAGDSSAVSTLNFLVLDFDSPNKKLKSIQRLNNIVQLFSKRTNCSIIIFSGFGFHCYFPIHPIPADEYYRLNDYALNIIQDHSDILNPNECKIDILTDPARMIRLAGTFNQGELCFFQKKKNEDKSPLILGVNSKKRRDFNQLITNNYEEEDCRVQTKEETFKLLNEQLDWSRSFLSPCLTPRRNPNQKGSHKYRVVAGIELIHFFYPRIHIDTLALFFKNFKDFNLRTTRNYLLNISTKNYCLPSCRTKIKASEGFGLGSSKCKECIENDPEFFYKSETCDICKNLNIIDEQKICLSIRSIGVCYFVDKRNS